MAAAAILSIMVLHRSILAGTATFSALALLLWLASPWETPMLSTATAHGDAVRPVGESLRLAADSGIAQAPSAEPIDARRAAAVADAWLNVFDAEWMIPLDPTSVKVTGGRLTVGVPSEVQVEARGYVPVHGVLVPERGENRILLERAGVLAVVLRTVDGEPVEGVEVTLLAPRASPVGANAGLLPPETSVASPEPLIRATDASGRATWEGLPALEGYRWAVPSPRLVDPTPAHEARRLSEVDGALRVGELPPPGVSGRFTVPRGSALELIGTVLAGASVSGRVDCRACDTPPVVSLCAVSVGGDLAAPRGTAFDDIARRATGARGEFRFDDQRPGTYLVRAWWQEGRGDLHFAAQGFELKAGSELDLGTLTSLDGSTLEIELGIQDTQGQRLAPSAVYVDSGREPFGNFTIDVAPLDGDAAHMLSGVLALSFGEPMRLHGLRPGRVFVTLQPGHGLRIDRSRVVRLDPDQPPDFAVGSLERLELRLTAHLGYSRPLLALDPSEGALPVPGLWARDRTTDEVKYVTTSAPSEGDPEGSRRLLLPEGTYDLWSALPMDGRRDGFVGRATTCIQAGDQQAIELTLEPASILRGVLRDHGGRPLGDRVLGWTCESWPASEIAQALYTARTDANGEFTLGAVPFGRRLRGLEAGTDLELVPARAAETFQLVVPR